MRLLRVLAIIALIINVISSFHFHRKLMQTSALANRLEEKHRMGKRVHNLSLLRLGKLFRTSQQQVKRDDEDHRSLPKLLLILRNRTA
ncbi:unnamed protein product [Bursaphelenchus xylophilus]|uniref:(pine wood nematode) hypothetical protein n=1 Tax=Bursaphelenchus xylophilus TaxID=6326 RepID=A0A1I7S3G4_BURXY|nr:unnamed protein product [Bursaphelenchus xylophilus]CAG9116292.1 unnamed protein product [Bursaphelenchus xylophilus]